MHSWMRHTSMECVYRSAIFCHTTIYRWALATLSTWQSGYLYSCLTPGHRAQGGRRAFLTLPVGLPRGTLTALLSPPRLSGRYRTMTGTWLKHDHWRPIIQQPQTNQGQQPPKKRRFSFTGATHKFRIKKTIKLNDVTTLWVMLKVLTALQKKKKKKKAILIIFDCGTACANWGRSYADKI